MYQVSLKIFFKGIAIKALTPPPFELNGSQNFVVGFFFNGSALKKKILRLLLLLVAKKSNKFM